MEEKDKSKSGGPVTKYEQTAEKKNGAAAEAEFSQVPDEKEEPEKSKLEVIKYQKASTLKLTKKERDVLEEEIDPKDINIRPDGLIYYPQVYSRERLNRAFGPGQWALIEHGVIKDPEHNKAYMEGSLYIRGCFVAKAIGESNYFPTDKYGKNNKMFSWASVHESMKSDCIVRCCKDLGIGKECWQPAFVKSWINEHAVQVWRAHTGKHLDPQTKNWIDGSYQWRLSTDKEFWDEIEAPPGMKDRNYDEGDNYNQQSKAPEKKQERKKNSKGLNPFIDYNKVLSTAANLTSLKQAWDLIPSKEKKKYEPVKNKRKKELEEIEKKELENKNSTSRAEVDPDNYDHLIKSFETPNEWSSFIQSSLFPFEVDPFLKVNKAALDKIGGVENPLIKSAIEQAKGGLQ